MSIWVTDLFYIQDQLLWNKLLKLRESSVHLHILQNCVIIIINLNESIEDQTTKLLVSVISTGKQYS